MTLQNDQPFPTIKASKLDGGETTLPDELEQGWNVLLFYRGVW